MSAVVVAAATLAGVLYDVATPRPLTLVERTGSPGMGVSSPTSETTPVPTVDLAAVRALPPAGSGDTPSVGSTGDRAAPARLALPALGVGDAPVVPVGIDAAGGLEIPGAREVGWYRLGSRPGAGAGSVVLAAHVAYDGVDGVFRHLGSLEPGDAVTVTTGDGRQLGYRVDSVAVHRKADLPIDDLFNPSSAERLVLITCGGAFNPQLRHYESNIVVIAGRSPDS